MVLKEGSSKVLISVLYSISKDALGEETSCLKILPRFQAAHSSTDSEFQLEKSETAEK